MKKIRVGVIFGGRSGEHEVSLVSAESVIWALDKKKYEVIPIAITKLGKWLFGKGSLAALKSGKEHLLTAVTLHSDPQNRGLVKIEKRDRKTILYPLDVVFPVLHGPYGEDGTMQGLLELANIPYVGCGVLASALAMDKLMAKTVFDAHKLPQTQYMGISRSQFSENPKRIEKMILKKIGLPCFVKPSNLGSSVGITKVKKANRLKDAFDLAVQFDARIIVEKAVPNAREIECSVLGNENPIASIAGEIIPSREFYDYYAKYVDGKSKLLIPAPISKEKQKEVQTLSIKAYQALNCSGMARVDFLMDRKTEKLYLSEINTIPGFTSISMYPKLWAASGLPYPKLIDRLIELAFERHREKSRNRISFESGSEWYKRQEA